MRKREREGGGERVRQGERGGGRERERQGERERVREREADRDSKRVHGCTMRQAIRVQYIEFADILGHRCLSAD